MSSPTEDIDPIEKQEEPAADECGSVSSHESLDDPEPSTSKGLRSSDSAELLAECKSFISNVSDPVKFSYAGLCATTLHVLYGTKRDKDYRHHFLTSFVAHLSLTSNVMNTMHAISDGQALGDCSQQFLKDLLQDKEIKDNKKMLVKDLVSWAVVSSKGKYDSRSRILIRHITWQLPLQLEVLEEIEQHLLEMLSERTDEEKKVNQQERQKSEKRQKFKRYALIGLATAGGGALIGLTGGLAAPLVAAGAGAVLGGASAAALSSVAGIAIITSLFGAAGAGLTGYKMKRRVGGVDEFEFQQITSSNQLAITIAVSGWLSDDNKNNFFFPWRDLHQSSEQYTLLWESEHLKRLGKAFEYILDSLVSFAATEALKYTVLAGIITAVAWPASLISVAGVIDNPWSVCLQRSAQVGRQLAEVLIAREHGQRPVTLIGYSLGAKVIFHCLHHLSKKKNHSGLIEDVFLIGAPVSGSPEDWEELSSVVAGHITNAYCRNDWLLRFLYRTSSRQQKVAGLQPVEWENRRMINMDLSSIVTGHLDYVKNINTVLTAIGVRTKGLVRSPTGCVLLKSDENKEE